ncbi:MAG: hypothetical protein QOE90_2358 [Thermoplasmata archaeon]|jgi:hypothetical protein|nr:hypothetical protein [Thermoplasmata archaeon]
MRNVLLACVVALAVLAAGCTKAPAPEGETPAATDGPAPSSPAGAPPATNATSGDANGTAPGDPSPGSPSSPSPSASPSNGTVTAPGAPIAWAAPDAAKIRPGVQVITDGDPRDPTSAGGQRECTSNFVFTSPDNASVYLGVAAHCVSGLQVGAPADVGPGIAKGAVAYSSWYAMNNSEVPDDPTHPAACTSEADAATCDANDFALIRLDPKDVAITSPAMLHFGGPVGLATSGSVQPLDKILTYGNSDLRQGQEPIMEKEGYVTEETAWTTYAETQFPVLPGDSGSGALTADGHALGIVVTSTLYAADPFNPPTTTGITNLDHALAYAQAHGMDVRLATWQLLDPGTLPPV